MMEKFDGKIDVGTPVLVLSPGNEGKHGIVRQNLGFHKEDEAFNIPSEDGAQAKAHRTDQWWWVESTGSPFNAYHAQVKIQQFGPFMSIDVSKSEMLQRTVMFFPDKELVPLPRAEDGEDIHTEAPIKQEKPVTVEA